ncbi:Hsp20/alpha crystallin family protein [Candidatus Trichorickettsia mobilis]|uniref:Hsp20/alpha crystallin family protein n=1 Tax=Candidatus Trichorickettsia mobilis TaxID=1346319 RepID=A0ABZ0UUI7_9RICK|nr:Hsp20/alpha crystallin family protein [Candidatus Trichorickettsia mobilis]WPY00762.1 Hsp20/alpha crystallin family protein [Candidatus Trichorickettsia mobilis]
MDINKWNPWNWLKNEENHNHTNSETHKETTSSKHPMLQLHREIDRLFDSALNSFGFPALKSASSDHNIMSGFFKPSVDIMESDKEYTITMEVPGVEEENVNLELANRTLTIRGDKKKETTEENKNFHCIERSYGSFQRVLSLPNDAEEDGIEATFKNGVLTITLPRNLLTKDVRKINIKK